MGAARLTADGGQEALTLKVSGAAGDRVSVQIEPDDVVRLTGRPS
jgi:hypothetical protein